MPTIPPQEKKEQIRKEILGKRDSLRKEEILEHSEEIRKQLAVLDLYSKSKVVMFYASFGSEVHTHEMIAEALFLKKVLLPKMVGGEIVPSLILSMDNLLPSSHGILEPIEALPVKHSTIDAVIVPGIAFDPKGNRLGFGKGYYDRFLRRVPHAVKIGLAFDSQIVDCIPTEAHDIGMDVVVMPRRVVVAKKANIKD